MGRVILSDKALGDISRLYNFLYDIDIDAAMKSATVINQALLLLEDNSHLGRPMSDETGRRELFMAFGAGSYVLRYKIDTHGNSYVVRIWHSRESR